MTLTGDLVGNEAAQTMEMLEKEYAFDESARVVAVAVVAAVSTMEDPDGGPGDSEEGYTVTHVHCSEIISYRVVGLLASGLRAVQGE